jgi:hypothetical protein
MTTATEAINADRLHRSIINAVTEYDRKQSTKKGYNIYALAHYCLASQRADRYIRQGVDPRDAILNCFLGRLCDHVLKACKLQTMTTTEAKFGPDNRLPELQEDD